jgi:hypothetical protein
MLGFDAPKELELSVGAGPASARTQKYISIETLTSTLNYHNPPLPPPTIPLHTPSAPRKISKDGTRNSQVKETHHRDSQILDPQTKRPWAEEGCEEYRAEETGFG